MHSSAFRCGVVNCRDDVVIGSAATQVAAHPVADFLRRAGVAFCDAGNAGHDLPRRAITALETIALDEGGLQRMKPLALSEALDGPDLTPVHEGRERETRFHALAVHQDRTGAALAEATAFLRPRKVQVLTQGVEERSARIERQPVLGSVD